MFIFVLILYLLLPQKKKLDFGYIYNNDNKKL